MKTLENLELSVPHLSSDESRGLFGGWCDICMGGYCTCEEAWWPWSPDGDGNIWYGDWLVYDNHGNDEGNYNFDYDYGNNGNADDNAGCNVDGLGGY